MIEEITRQIASAWRDTSAVELIAAILAVAYLLLAIRQYLSCWFAAFVSSVLYVWVFFGAHLYMDALLQGFYAAMAAYGFWRWRRGEDHHSLPVIHWSLNRHLIAAGAVLLLSLITSFFLRRYTPAASPFLDSLVTWSSIYTTYLVAQKVYENWHWWLIIDSVSLGLYFSRGLYLTTLLFALYLVLIVVGMREWRRDLVGAYAPV
ncbi:MAG TPA: nicotinamide riboside transporter PnuC [Steroidobacteraceae bacterium]